MKNKFKIYTPVCFGENSTRVQVGIITVGERGSLFLSLLFFEGFYDPERVVKRGDKSRIPNPGWNTVSRFEKNVPFLRNVSAKLSFVTLVR